MTTESTALTLATHWQARIKLRAEGDRLWAEGSKLRTEGNRLWAEGDRLWAEAILDIFGNITLEWEWVKEKEDSRCILGNGEVYDP